MQLGEEAPKEWTISELSVRIQELKEEKGIPVNTRGKTPLRAMIIKMNQASRRKGDLQVFAQSELGLTITRNETVVQLQKSCLTKIYMITEPSQEDPVAFGAHSSLNYGQLLQQEPQYCNWVRTTAQEGQCDYRLARLARWLEMEKQPETSKPPYQKEILKTPVANEKEKVGYKSPPHGGISKTLNASSAASEGSVTSSQREATHQMMTQMASLLKDLKEDVDAIKESRPHKKSEKMETKSEDTFSMVTEQ